MSKSLGNMIVPQKVVSSLGADVLRLWVAATDYANEISVSDEILKRTADSYRRMRNTARFLLGNLAGFDPARDLLASERLVELDRWAIERTRELQSEVVAAYRDYAFHLIYQKVHNFCVVDLGGFYLDVIKDRLYTTRTDSEPRRSAQTALYWIAEGLSAMARADPVVHGGGDLAAHAGGAGRVGIPHDLGRAARHGPWSRSGRLAGGARGAERRAARARAAAYRGPHRRAARRGGRPVLRSRASRCAVGARRRAAIPADHLRGAGARRGGPAGGRRAPAGGEGAGAFWVSVDASSAAKCVRCWHKREDVGQSDRHPQLCARCVTNIDGPGEPRRFA